MSALVNIIRKELKELLTPATLLPIVVLALIFGSMGTMINGIEEDVQGKPLIGVIVNDHDVYSEFVENVLTSQANIVYNSTDSSNISCVIQHLEKENGVALIVIPKNFTDRILSNESGELEVYWIIKGAGMLDTVSSAAVEQLLTFVSRSISEELIQRNATVNPSFVLSPVNKIETTYFKGKEMSGVSPREIMGMLSSQSTVIPIVMMMIIIMAGSMVISSMALEKENKTLETLLTLPVRRSSIIAGKIVASAIVGLILAAIYMFGIGSYMQSFQGGGEIDLAGFDLVLTLEDFFLIGVSLFITLVAALSLCFLLGTLAKNYRSGQTLTFPVTMMALFPMLLTMFLDFDTMPLGLQIIVFLIPFSHPMIAPRALLFDNYFLVFSGVVYVAVFAFSVIAVVVWVFKTDRVLTGTVSVRDISLFKRKK